ncbi:Ribonuclease 3 [bacterium HR35]|nr:Ribonuclease 3 [bacterium HR35]
MLKKLLKIEEIEKIFNIKIKDENIWLEALIHKSWLFYHHRSDLPNNEKLEFLGDAILQMFVSLYLYKNFKELDEGKLSLLRSNLINRHRLGDIALKLKLDKIINISPILDKKGKLTVLGDSLEAVIGALYLDQGPEITQKFIQEHILQNIEEIIKKGEIKDPKTYFQEIIQKKYGFLPEYKILDISGPAHQRRFKVGIFLKDIKLTEGEGTSKQEAEFEAALKAIKKLEENNFEEF